MSTMTQYTFVRCALLLLAVVLGAPTGRSHAQEAWTLNNDARRQYLRYYSPVIFKRADEGGDHDGYDWITSFDFDQDAAFATNKDHWEKIDCFASPGRAECDECFDKPTDPPTPCTRTIADVVPEWKVRPTLYSSLIEFMDGNKKSVVLLYHVYHAKQQSSIHDWERIEVRINNVAGTPGGAGEKVKYVVITEHSSHKARKLGEEGLNFMETPNGKHPMIWQAEWSGLLGFHRGELHFVKNAWTEIDASNQSESPAIVDVNGTTVLDPNAKVNYVFVVEDDPDAVGYWDAEEITPGTAQSLSASTSNSVTWDRVPRVTYELQDLADIFPTHSKRNPFHSWHWDPEKKDKVKIFFESFVVSEKNKLLIGAGFQRFAYLALDVEDPDEDRKGYPAKHWFWGAYLWNRSGNFRSEALEEGAPNGERGIGTEHHGVSLDDYWWQHDYYAHDGVEGTGDPNDEVGQWLPGEWYTEENGGFDGRWVQLFDDDHLFEIPVIQRRDCGLLGIEMLFPFGLIAWLRRRQRA